MDGGRDGWEGDTRSRGFLSQNEVELPFPSLGSLNLGLKRNVSNGTRSGTSSWILNKWHR